MLSTRVRIVLASASLTLALGACLPTGGGAPSLPTPRTACEVATSRVTAALSQLPGAPSGNELAALIAAQTAACSAAK